MLIEKEKEDNLALPAISSTTNFFFFFFLPDVPLLTCVCFYVPALYRWGLSAVYFYFFPKYFQGWCVLASHPRELTAQSFFLPTLYPHYTQKSFNKEGAGVNFLLFFYFCSTLFSFFSTSRPWLHTRALTDKMMWSKFLLFSSYAHYITPEFERERGKLLMRLNQDRSSPIFSVFGSIREHFPTPTKREKTDKKGSSIPRLAAKQVLSIKANWRAPRREVEAQ